MGTKFVDTNILLEAYFRKGEKSDRCLRLLESDENLYTSINLPGLEIPDKKLIAQALKLFESLNLDWADCLNAVLSRNLEIGEVYSYDRDFEKVSGIKRLEP